MVKVTVTQLRLASESWELLARDVSGSPGAWKETAGFKGGEVPGALFHGRIGAPLFGDLAAGKLDRLLEEIGRAWGETDCVAKLLRTVLHERYLEPLMSRLAPKLSSSQLIGLATATDQLATAMGAILSRFPRPATVDQIRGWILPPERTHRAEYALSGSRSLSVVGRFDAALFDPEAGRVLLLEFKCKSGDQAPQDLLQCALYSWLVERATGLPADAAVLYLGTDGGTVRYGADELRAVASEPATRLFLEKVHGLVSRGPARTKEKPQELPSQDEAAGWTRSLLAALGKLGCQCRALPPIVGTRIVRCRVVPSIGKTPVARLARQAADLQVHLGLGQPPVIRSAEGYVAIDIPRKRPGTLFLGEAMEKGRSTRPASVAAFPLGMTVDGSVLWADLSNPTMSSVLVGGTSGSGKSEFLRSAAVALCLSGSCDQVRLTLVDPKLITFASLQGLTHIEGGIVTEPEIALEKLSRLVEEMEARYGLFARCGACDVEGYVALGRPLAHLVVIIDEFAELMVAKKTKEPLEAAVQRLGQKGRAAGIHLVLATQRPEASVVSPLIKANLQLKVALKVSSKRNSRLILDEDGAENLLGRGDMLVGGAIPIVRLQCPLTTRTEIERLGRARD